MLSGGIYDYDHAAHHDADCRTDRPGDRERSAHYGWEDDLDNSLIYDLVIKQISENKGKRQIIVATHNSNVVVNGDSELVNVMGMCNGQIMVKTKGGMGESAIRNAICSIMEGGQEALRHRYKRLSGGC